VSTYAQSKTKPGTRGETVDITALIADLDVIPPCRGFHANTEGDLYIWGPDDDLSESAVRYTVMAGVLYPYEVRRIDESASTVESITLIF
jgi:hypothetical protein